MTRFSLGRHARPRTGGLGPSPTAASSPPPARGQAFPGAWRSDWAPESRFHPNISHRAERRSNDGRGGRELQLRTEAHVSVTRSALLGGEAGDAACVARGRWLDRRARRAGRLSRGACLLAAGRRVPAGDEGATWRAAPGAGGGRGTGTARPGATEPGGTAALLLRKATSKPRRWWGRGAQPGRRRGRGSGRMGPREQGACLGWGGRPGRPAGLRRVWGRPGPHATARGC